MWSETRAESARRDLGALAGAALSTDDVLAVAIDVVGRVVPFDATCWATVDPGSMLLTASTTVAFDPSAELERHFIELEYAGEEVNSFASIAEREVPVARLSDAPHREVVRSERLHEIYRPLGVDHEVRMACMVDGACWAVAGILRSGGSPDFDDREVAFLQTVAPAVARATRDAVRREPEHLGGDSGSAVIVLGADGLVRSSTPAARRWVDALARGQGPGVALRGVVAMAARTSGEGVARLRDERGQWMIVRASPLVGDRHPREFALTVEPAAPGDLVRLLLQAHGLSSREQEVTLEVVAGRSTAEIARQLYIAPNTVQDHLKSVFAKVGVRSRRELVARLR